MLVSVGCCWFLLVHAGSYLFLLVSMGVYCLCEGVYSFLFVSKCFYRFRLEPRDFYWFVLAFFVSIGYD